MKLHAMADGAFSHGPSVAGPFTLAVWVTQTALLVRNSPIRKGDEPLIKVHALVVGGLSLWPLAVGPLFGWEFGEPKVFQV